MSSAPVSRHFTYPGGRRVHYRRTGSGPPLVMLHASPGSSFGLQPMMRLFAETHTVIAIDTPGYGESESLAPDRPAIRDYAAALGETLSALHLDRADVYGSHTGAVIALEFAAFNPQRVRRLVLDGLWLLDAAERADVLAHYTPSLAPETDGTHLIRAWSMQRDMMSFWPWYRRSAEGRMYRPLPDADALHDQFVDFLRAIPDYWKGYRAAFEDDLRPALGALSVPTLVTASTADPLHLYLDRLEGASPSITVWESNGARDAVAARAIAFLRGDALPPAPAPIDAPAPPGVVRRSFTATSIGEVLTRRSGDGTAGRPLVLFHAAPGSSAYFEPLLAAMGQDRPVYTFDTPGNGDSAPLGGLPDIWDFQAILGEAIDAHGIDEFDVYGSHTGALIAIETAIRLRQRVQRVVLDGITLFTPDQTADYLANYPIPLRISSDGGHLLWAWTFRRDMGLWWPWYNRSLEGLRPEGGVAPADLQHAGYVEFMKGGRTYHLSYRAAFAYPTRERLPLVTQPVLQASTAADPLRAAIPEAMTMTRRGESRIHEGNANPATHALYRTFYAGQALPPGPAV